MFKITAILCLVMSTQLALAATPQKAPVPTPATILPVGTTITSKLLTAVPLNMSNGSVYVSRVDAVSAPNGAKLATCHLISTASITSTKADPQKTLTLKPSTLHCLNAKTKLPQAPVRLTGYHVFEGGLAETQPAAHATVYMNKNDTLSTILNADITIKP